jgi:hypothetical protein
MTNRKLMLLTTISLVFSSSFSLAQDSGAKPIVTEGLYRQFSFVDKFQFSAAMLTQPDRLKTVTLGTAYTLNTDEISDQAMSSLVGAWMNGTSGIAVANPDGTFVVNSDWSKVLPNTDWHSCTESKVDQKVSSDCRKVFETFAGQQQLYVVFAEGADQPVGTRVGKVINWSAGPRVENPLQR